MKKMFIAFMAFFIFLGLIASCDFYGKAPEESRTEESRTGDMAGYGVRYNLRVVNKSGVAVTIYGPGLFYQAVAYTSLSNTANQMLCRVESGGETSSEFSWTPKSSLYYSDDPANPDPPAERIKEKFQPSTVSFYFKLAFGEGEDAYIAGWPETIDYAPEPKEEWNMTTIPREKIVQYGFGYADNRDVRIEEGFAYVPFTIKGAAKVEYDFDRADTVYGNAVLTIKAADDISFETLSFSAEETP